MKLNYNSFSSKLYRWVYGIDKKDIPSNLCEYFWYLFLAYIIALPTLILTIPFEIYAIIKGRDNLNKQFLERISFSVIIILIIMAVICLITSAIVFFSYDNFDNLNPALLFLTTIGFMLWVVGGMLSIIGFIIGFIISFTEEDVKRWVVKLIKRNIITQFIRAKIKNHCPRINWVDK